MNVFEQKGIKEVCDVTFYDLSNNVPVLYVDTAKVSTVEQTAEVAEARGGKGNPSLVLWDYGREINITLEDALFSAKSMAVMFAAQGQTWTSTTEVLRTFKWTPTAETTTVKTTFDGANQEKITLVSASAYDSAGAAVTSFKANETYYVTGYVAVGSAHKIEISANTFPGTYKIVGDTYARSSKTGKDSMFQIVINKAKVLADQTITMEAEGDPSTFNLNLRALRPDDNSPIMELIEYDLKDVQG